MIKWTPPFFYQPLQSIDFLSFLVWYFLLYGLLKSAIFGFFIWNIDILENI